MKLVVLYILLRHAKNASHVNYSMYCRQIGLRLKDSCLLFNRYLSCWCFASLTHELSCYCCIVNSTSQEWNIRIVFARSNQMLVSRGIFSLFLFFVQLLSFYTFQSEKICSKTLYLIYFELQERPIWISTNKGRQMDNAILFRCIRCPHPSHSAN